MKREFHVRFCEELGKSSMIVCYAGWHWTVAGQRLQRILSIVLDIVEMEESGCRPVIHDIAPYILMRHVD